MLKNLDDAIAAVRTQSLDQDLLSHGWTSEIVDRLAGWFEERRLQVESGWTPTSTDRVNMGMWFDHEGISPYADDVLKRAFRQAAEALDAEA